jgi:hypothetical protein
VPTSSNTPPRLQRDQAVRRRLGEGQLVDAMMALHQHHRPVFDALVTIIAHADARTLDAVAELVDFALWAGISRSAPTTIQESGGGRGEQR